MADKTVEKQLLSYFQALAKPEQDGVIKYLKSLLKKNQSSNKEILKLAGSISIGDIGLMQQAIEEDCENIDRNEW